MAGQKALGCTVLWPHVRYRVAEEYTGYYSNGEEGLPMLYHKTIVTVDVT